MVAIQIIKVRKLLLSLISILILILIVSIDFNSDNLILDCKGVKIDIPDNYLVKQSRFIWLEKLQSLDNEECSARVVFKIEKGDKLLDLHVPSIVMAVLTISNLEKSQNAIEIEKNALLRKGIFNQSLLDINSNPGFVTLYEQFTSTQSHIFNKNTDRELLYIGTCSQYVDEKRQCVVTFKYKELQFQFSLLGDSINAQSYNNLIEMMEMKAKEWTIN